MPNIPPRVPAEERAPLPQTLFVLPAYGRRYSTSEQARVDWIDGKDFKIVGSGYLSIRDLDYLLAHGVAIISIVDHHGNVTCDCSLVGPEASVACKAALLSDGDIDAPPRGKP